MEYIEKAGTTAKDSVAKIYKKVKDSSLEAQKFAKDTMPTSLSFLSVSDLLEWSKKITQSKTTIYDRAMDAEYAKTHIGGGSHRMFDGGHDLINAWEKVQKADSDDTLKQEVIGYVSAIWKDVPTVKGLPFVTWEKENYEVYAEWVSNNIPGATKDWFYDLMSYDVFEVLSSSISVAAVLFFLNKGDTKRLSEILGAMGIVAITSANPLLGIGVVFCTAYSYYIKKQEIDIKHAAKGATIAGISACIFAVLGFPVLIEFGIVIIATLLIRKKVLDNEVLSTILCKFDKEANWAAPFL